MYLRAEFSDVEAAAAAVQTVSGAGVDKRDVEVFSARPVVFEPGILDRPSRMSLLAVVSAIVVGSGATALMYYTQLDYPLITGGMPLNSGWATGVITFELTMLGAILGAVGGFLWESGLLRKNRSPAPAIRDDVITMQVRCDQEGAERLVRLLADSGAITSMRVADAS